MRAPQMLCFPKSVAQPKKPREELLPLPPAALWGSGAQHWVCPHQPRIAGTQNTAVLPFLSLAPEHFWHSSSTHSAPQSACLLRLGPFHGYCRLLLEAECSPHSITRHQVFTYGLPEFETCVLQNPQGGARQPARHPTFATVRNRVRGISSFLWSLTE